MNAITLINTINNTYPRWGYMLLNTYQINYAKRYESDIERSKYYFNKIKGMGFRDKVTDLNSSQYEEIIYGNYNLKKIYFEDFKNLSFENCKTDVYHYIKSTHPIYKLNDDEVHFLFHLIIENYFKQIYTPVLSLKLDINKLEQEGKRLSFKGYFDHFQAYLFFFPGGNMEIVHYLELGCD